MFNFSISKVQVTGNKMIVSKSLSPRLNDHSSVRQHYHRHFHHRRHVMSATIAVPPPPHLPPPQSPYPYHPPYPKQKNETTCCRQEHFSLISGFASRHPTTSTFIYFLFLPLVSEVVVVNVKIFVISLTTVCRSRRRVGLCLGETPISQF